MNLTFKGFLRGYCRELTGLCADNLRKLCAYVDRECPAAAEAVMVFAAVQGKAAYLESLSQGTWMHRSYSEFVAGFREFSSAEEFLQTPQAPQRFAKVWLAYQAKKQSIVADRRVILLMRDKTLQAMSAAGVTAYRLCKDMGLNLGNVYAYLNKGDATKVSKGTARRMMQHAEQLAAQ